MNELPHYGTLHEIDGTHAPMEMEVLADLTNFVPSFHGTMLSVLIGVDGQAAVVAIGCAGLGAGLHVGLTATGLRDFANEVLAVANEIDGGPS